MANIITDETIEYVGILAKLELSPLEREEAKKDMGRMLDYIDKLNELDTAGVEPMVNVFSMNNVFREDVVTNKDDSDDILKNAPEKKDGAFKVPRTVEKGRRAYGTAGVKRPDIGRQDKEKRDFRSRSHERSAETDRGTGTGDQRICDR